MRERKRRIRLILFLCFSFVSGVVYQGLQKPVQPKNTEPQVQGNSVSQIATSPALEALATLPVKGRAPQTNYSRAQFDANWELVGACDVRNHILARDMHNVKTVSETDCTVASGMLNDPYTGEVMSFSRGPGSSTAVQIDHVVALSNAWQTGAQQLTPQQRQAFANDALNLLAVDGPTNQKKGDGDAATWLPPNKDYRCRYVARQIAVKVKYSLWVTVAEYDAIKRVLGNCPDQVLPIVGL